MPPKHIEVIVNPNSGRGRHKPLAEYFGNELPPAMRWTEHATTCAGHATELAHEAVLSGADAVIAVGGDGTVNEVSKALIGTEIPLGVIPQGSGNGFARHMKIPMNTRAAVRRIARFRTAPIDTATLNGMPFLATAGLGFDAQVGWRFSEYDKRGLPSYLRASAETFFNFKPRTYRLVIDGEARESEAFLISFANAGQYGNNAWIAPSASISDGKLNVCILKNFPRHLAPEIIFRIFSRQIENSKYYELIQAREIVVENPEQFHVDGEPLEGESELRIQVNPRSLRVII